MTHLVPLASVANSHIEPTSHQLAHLLALAAGFVRLSPEGGTSGAAEQSIANWPAETRPQTSKAAGRPIGLVGLVSIARRRRRCKASSAVR